MNLFEKWFPVPVPVHDQYQYQYRSVPVQHQYQYTPSTSTPLPVQSTGTGTGTDTDTGTGTAVRVLGPALLFDIRKSLFSIYTQHRVLRILEPFFFLSTKNGFNFLNNLSNPILSCFLSLILIRLPFNKLHCKYRIAFIWDFNKV